MVPLEAGWLVNYERWVNKPGTNPGIVSYAVVFTLLALVTLPSIRRWTKSVRAFFWFSATNAFSWIYLWLLEGRISPAWQVHMRVLIIHAITVTGAWLVGSLVGKYILGWEDTEG